MKGNVFPLSKDNFVPLENARLLLIRSVLTVLKLDSVASSNKLKSARLVEESFINLDSKLALPSNNRTS